MVHRRRDDAGGEALQRYIESLEDGPFTTDFKRLASAGVELSPPDSLNDEQLTRKLWEVIHALARLRTFITSTDHLSDRELYTRLWTDALHHDVPAEDLGPGASHVDFASAGSAEDVEAWLRYYADDDARREWVQDFQDDILPARQKCPHDRDRHLPQPHDQPDRLH